MVGRRIVLLAVLFSEAGPCGPSAATPADRSMSAIHDAFVGVAQFRDSVGYLPNRLVDVCRISMTWCYGDSARWVRDGWGHRLSYSVTDTTYEIRSLGKDGLPNTGDDISLSSTQEHRWVQEFAGCYEFSRRPPGASEGPFVLDTVPTSAAQYRLLPLDGHRRAVWYPMPGHQVWLAWLTTPSGIVAKLEEASGDSLVGTGFEGSDFAPGRQRRIVAYRTACPSLAP